MSLIPSFGTTQTAPTRHAASPLHFWGGGVDEAVMQALSIQFFTCKKCYRELVARVIKECHKRWKYRNTQLADAGELTPHPWFPKPHVHKLATPHPPHKRKRDVAWSTQRSAKTYMQKILYNFTHCTLIQQGRRGRKGTGGNVTCQERGIMYLTALVAVSPVRLPRNKRRLITDIQAGHRSRSTRQRKNKATVRTSLYIHTVHIKHKGTIQPIQHTYCTTGQASLHGGGDDNYTDFLFKN
jgi:hypothetical protein